MSARTLYMWQYGMCITYCLKFKKIEDFFVANGYELVSDPAQASLIIVGTCASFIPFLERYAKKIREVNGAPGTLVVYGCLPFIDPKFYKETSMNVHLLVHPNMPEKMAGLIEDAEVPWSAIPEPSDFRTEDHDGPVLANKRYITIQDGCSENCAFCPHRLAIGRPRSRLLDEILTQVSHDLSSGATIVAIEGNDPGAWGTDLVPPRTFPELVHSVRELDGSFEIYIGNLAPKWVIAYGDSLLGCGIRDLKVPVQSSSSRLLGVVGRDPAVREIAPILKRLRASDARIRLRTEIIIGLPTETDDEFLNTLDFVAENFDRVACYTFDYHPRTAIGDMDLPFVDDAVMERRVMWAMDYFKTRPEIEACFDMGGRVLQECVSRRGE